jgi:AraC family transcriptional regulator
MEQSMKNQIEDAQKNLAKSLEPLLGKEELLVKVIEFFPYPIQIFSPDGTAVMINKATVDVIGIRDVESHVGKYNVFSDPIVRELGAMDRVREVLKGKTVYLTDFNAPYQDMIRYFNVEDRDIQTISSDITCFPLVNANGKVEYFAAVFIIKKIYRGKEEISRGKQYIETHWQEPFDLNETARAACLSKSQFIKLFKKHTGVTPHEYYINYKIGKLKEKLLDTNLSVAQAFAACNMDYNGHSARLFREKVGVSPSEYRKMSAQNAK